MDHRFPFHRLAYFCALVLWAGVGARAEPNPDVGVVNMIAGDVSYANEDRTSGKVLTYMRVRQGDRFSLAPGSEIRLVYFQGGRQETWKGPVSFTAGDVQSQAGGGANPSVTQLPTVVPNKMRQVPELLALAKLGEGGVMVRGLTPKQQASLEQQEDLAKAKQAYQQMRNQLGPDDITPELYMLQVLHEYLLYGEMQPYADELLRKQPNNPDVRDVVAWVKAKSRSVPRSEASGFNVR